MATKKQEKESDNKRKPTPGKAHDLSNRPYVSATTPLPEAWRNQIIHIVQKELATLRTSIQKLPTDQRREMEPAPTPGARIPGGKKGKPIKPGKRIKIAGTIDSELYRLIREWENDRGTTLSYALDTAIWHFFNKPKLSFEISELSDRQSE
jgi:hypothetical protein